MTAKKPAAKKPAAKRQTRPIADRRKDLVDKLDRANEELKNVDQKIAELTKKADNLRVKAEQKVAVAESELKTFDLRHYPSVNDVNPEETEASE